MQQAIIFPETYPNQEIVLPLLLVFNEIVYCRPVEKDVPELDIPLMQETAEKDLLRFFAPAPLGTDRERFLHLARDIKHRRDDYAAQLGSLSLAGLSNDSSTNEQKSSIISNLLQQQGISEQEAEKKALLLWQARLLLILGEQFDREQMELQQNLATVHARQENLLAELRQDDDSPFSLTETLLETGSRNDAMLKLRIKAWVRLVTLGSNPLPHCVLLTSSQDALDMLFEQYHSLHDREPVQKGSLILPARVEADDYFDKRAVLLESGKNAYSDISDTVQYPQSHSPEAAVTQWDSLLADIYPQQRYGRARLDLYDFADCDPSSLLKQTFARDKGSLQTEIASKSGKGLSLGFFQQTLE